MVPSYDQASKFLLIDQEDCTYTKPIVDEATAELDDIFKNTDAQEGQEKEEDAVLDIFPTVSATTETDPKFLKARSHMREILKKVSGALKFSDYTEADTQEMLDVQTYLTDKTLGGGPIIGKKIFKDGANPIETPIRSIWQNMYKKITKAYKAGNEQEGGLFYIKNVQLDDPKVDGNQYVDVFLATTSAEDYNALIGKNNTDEIKCCFNDHLEGEGLKLNFNGLARIIQYTRDEEDKNKVAIERVWDGQVKEGVPAGFGRLVDGLQSSSFIGQLYDTKATYKGLYYEGLQPKYQGIYDNVDYDVEPTNFQFANFKPEKVDTVIEPTDEEKKKIKEEAKKAGIREENALDPSKNKGAFKKKR